MNGGSTTITKKKKDMPEEPLPKYAVKHEAPFKMFAKPLDPPNFMASIHEPFLYGQVNLNASMERLAIRMRPTSAMPLTGNKKRKQTPQKFKSLLAQTAHVEHMFSHDCNYPFCVGCSLGI